MKYLDNSFSGLASSLLKARAYKAGVLKSTGLTRHKNPIFEFCSKKNGWFFDLNYEAYKEQQYNRASAVLCMAGNESAGE